MKKVIKTIFSVAVAAVLIFALIKFGPAVYAAITGKSETQWVSTKLSEAITGADELVVSKVEAEGVESISKNVNFLLFTSTTQKLELPYSFYMEFKVDLSRAVIAVKDGQIEIRVPSPFADNAQLSVDEDKVRKSDFFDPIRNDQYAEYKKQLTARLFEEYSAKPEYLDQAWQSTVADLEGLYLPVIQQTKTDYQVIVLRDDTLPESAKEAE